MINKIKQILTKVINAFSFLIKVYRCGGYGTANIAYINRGELLKGKRVLITGGGSGIGLSIARKCIEEGATVVITGRNENKLKDALIEIDDSKLKLLKWDHSQVSQNKNKIEEAESLLCGEIDILVNNAGVMDGVGFPNVKEEVWDKVYETNSKGLFFLTQEITQCWMKNKNRNLKKIINISSQGGFVGSLNPYRMTKWDIAGLTQGLGLELASHGIIVNGIAPGIILTDMQRKYLKQGENVYCDQNAIKRYAYPGEIAELAAFLIADTGNFIVGQTIISDGGYSLK